MSKNEGAGDEAPPKKSKKKLIVMLLAAVLMLGAGGGGAYVMLGSSSAEAAAEEEKPEPGIVVPLDAVTINLADGHYLKVKLALQATAEVTEEIDGSKALDTTIWFFSEKKMADLSTGKGRDKAKHELVEKVSEAYEGEVMDIYFTEFVMQ